MGPHNKGTTSTGGARQNRSRPNVVLITADQFRYDCTGYSGVGLVRTPNIDRIATEGMSFQHAYTAIPVCCPARQSLLSGRRAESFGALWNFDITLPTQWLPPQQFSWPRAFRDAGYRTAHFGKWHVSPDEQLQAYGYQTHLGLADYARHRTSLDTRITTNADTNLGPDWSGTIDDVAIADTQTHWLADKARQYIIDHATAEQPFLVALEFNDPHLPCRPHPEFAARYRPEDIRPWPSFADDFAGKPLIQHQQLYNWRVDQYSWKDWSPIVARYFAIIEQLDAAIGYLLSTIDELGLADETIVVFTADHGDMCGAHRMVDKHYVMYDDVVRVPLAIRAPGYTVANSTSDLFVTNTLDLGPTLLELAGIDCATDFHGRSLVPLLTGRRPADWRTAAIASYNGQQFGLYCQRMIRNRRWKYVWNPTDIDELYDLTVDPAELANLIADRGCIDTLAELRLQLLTELVRCDDGLVKNDWLRYQLRSGRKLAHCTTQATIVV